MNYQIPLYIQLKNLIIQRIKDGEYLPGEKIPSEREMSSLYHINRMTVKHAVNALIDEGYLFRIKNNGTFVTKKIANKILRPTFSENIFSIKSCPPPVISLKKIATK